MFDSIVENILVSALKPFLDAEHHFLLGMLILGYSLLFAFFYKTNHWKDLGETDKFGITLALGFISSVVLFPYSIVVSWILNMILNPALPTLNGYNQFTIVVLALSVFILHFRIKLYNGLGKIENTMKLVKKILFSVVPDAIIPILLFISFMGFLNYGSYSIMSIGVSIISISFLLLYVILIVWFFNISTKKVKIFFNAKNAIITLLLIILVSATLSCYARPQLTPIGNKLEQVYIYSAVDTPEASSDFIFKKSFTEQFNVKFQYLKWIPIFSDNITYIESCDVLPETGGCINNKNHAIITGSANDLKVTLRGLSDGFRKDNFFAKDSNSTHLNFSIYNPFNYTLVFMSEASAPGGKMIRRGGTMWLNTFVGCKLLNDSIRPKAVCDNPNACNVTVNEKEDDKLPIVFQTLDANGKWWYNRIFVFDNGEVRIDQLGLPPFYNLSMELSFKC